MILYGEKSTTRGRISPMKFYLRQERLNILSLFWLCDSNPTTCWLVQTFTDGSSIHNSADDLLSQHIWILFFSTRERFYVAWQKSHTCCCSGITTQCSKTCATLTVANRAVRVLSRPSNFCIIVKTSRNKRPRLKLMTYALCAHISLVEIVQKLF